MDRRLIINCDDFGMCRDVDEASLLAVTQGAATSLSIMAPAPHFAEAVDMARTHGLTHVGVHLTLTSEFPAMRFGGLSPAAEIPSLLDRDGHLRRTVEGFAKYARPEEVRVECERQIDAVIGAGLVPTHLDCHMFALHEAANGRTDLAPVVRDLCLGRGLPFRSPFPQETQYLQRHGVALVSHAPSTTYDVPARRKASAYTELLRQLEPGVSELIVHPGVDGPELRSMDTPRYRHSTRRLADLAFVCSQGLREVLHDEGIRLIAWQDAF